METDTRQMGELQQASPVAKLYLENTLLRVAGALFCHDPKRASARTGEIEVNASVAEKRIVIRPDPQLGQPGQLAHKIFVALLKKHSGYGRPVQADVSFSKRELMRLIGRKQWGGSDSEQLSRALNEIHYTFVRSSFRTRDGKWAEHSFSIFPEIYLERAERATDPIEKCTVTLARPIIASLEDDHFTCLNHTLMQELGTIGQALYMRLFFHFANLFDGHHKSRLTFPKRYDDICREWLGGLKVHPHRSLVERDQLGPHLRELVRQGFLASYAITKAKSGEGMILTFRPGATFFADYDRFYRHRLQGDFQFQFHNDRREVAEPLKVAYLFMEKRTGQKLTAIPYVSSKDVETAKQLLQSLSFADIGNFIQHGLAEAKKTNFDVQTLGGLRQYLAGYVQGRHGRSVAKAAAERRRAEERQEAARRAYEGFRSAQVDDLWAALPVDEREVIEALAQAGAPARGRVAGPLAETMSQTIHRIACRQIAAERHPDRVPSFREWEARHPQS
jgi:hypothetical protein